MSSLPARKTAPTSAVACPTPLLGPARLPSLALALFGAAAVSACESKPPPGADDQEGRSEQVAPKAAADPTLPPELEPKAEAPLEDAGAPPAPHPGPWFAVTSVAAAVYSEPVFDRKLKLGYVRNGGRVPVEAKPVSTKNCSGGWYSIVGGGYICGNQGTTDLDHPQVRFAMTQPEIDEILPYKYVRNAKHGTPLYKSVPSREQMYEYEPYLEGAKKAKAEQKAKAEAQAEQKAKAEQKAVPTPDTVSQATSAPGSGVERTSLVGDAGAPPLGLLDAGPAPAVDEPEQPWWQQENIKERLHEVKLEDLEADADDVLARRMVTGFYVAVEKTFRWNNRTWYKTTKGLVAPSERFWQAPGSKFKGVEIDGETWKLPIAWVHGGRKSTSLFEIDPEAKSIKTKGQVKRFEAIQLTGRTIELRGKDYSETRDGLWVREAFVRTTRPGPAPEELGPDEPWIDVNLSEQTLVAYRGNRPVFATLVSTGKKNKIKEKDHSTPIGKWRVREKHITTTMDGDGTAAGDLPYSIEDVPYVMYYHKAYATHAAFWHENYGVMMSHGCVNLSPLDAKYLFYLADPPLPEGWHGAWSTDDKPGSWVVVHD